MAKKNDPEYRHRWYLKNQERAKAYSRLWAKNHPEYRLNYLRNWRKVNPERSRELDHKSYRKWESNIRNKLSKRWSSYVRKCLNGAKNHKHWESLVGYTLEQLYQHLENHFQDGMSWDNYGEWHIDHIIPVSFFEFTSPSDVEFKMCWRLENLQPLWAEDNHKKYNKLL